MQADGEDAVMLVTPLLFSAQGGHKGRWADKPWMSPHDNVCDGFEARGVFLSLIFNSKSVNE